MAIVHVPPASLVTAAPFHDLFTISEYTLQEIADSMTREGYHESKPIEVWDEAGIVVDGHSRLRAALAAGLATVAVFRRPFPSEEDALEYAIANQHSRRNLTDAEMARCVRELDKRLKQGGDRGNQHTRPKATVNGTPDSEPTNANCGKSASQLLPPNDVGASQSGSSADRTAKLVGTSGDKVKKVRMVLDHGDEATKEAMLGGTTSINAASRKVREQRGKTKPAAPGGGQSKVNGVVVADPPDVAALRASCKIAPDVIVEVTEAEAPDHATPPPDATAPDVPDAEWLEALPVRAKLGPNARLLFDRDALAYRRVAAARGVFGRSVRSILKAADQRGELPTYLFRLRSFLRINDPSRWTLCPATEHGGCGGTGTVGMLGTCLKCRGGGYTL